MASGRVHQRHDALKPAPKIVDLADSLRDIRLCGENILERRGKQLHRICRQLRAVEKTLHRGVAVTRVVAHHDKSAARNQEIFESAHRDAVRQRASFPNDFQDGPLLATGFSLFDKETIFENTTSIQKKRNFVRRGDCPHFLEIGKGHRMAAASIQGKLDVNAADLCGAVLGNHGTELGQIDIALKSLMRGQVMSAIAKEVEQLSDVHIDMVSGRRKKHVAADETSRSEVAFRPKTIRRTHWS